MESEPALFSLPPCGGGPGWGVNPSADRLVQASAPPSRHHLHATTFTYAKSPGLLSIPRFGAAIQPA